MGAGEGTTGRRRGGWHVMSGGASFAFGLPSSEFVLPETQEKECIGRGG